MRILVTYGWCRTAYAVVRSLSLAGHKVFVCDCSRLAMSRFSRYAQGFDLTPDPFSRPAEFARAVAEIAKRREIDIVVPVHEDALPLQVHRNLLPAQTIVAAPPAEPLRHALDKGFMADLVEANGLRAPRTCQPRNLEELDEMLASMPLPVVIKTRRGNSGKGVIIAHTRDEARKAYVALVQRVSLPQDRLPLLQEFVTGRPCGACFLAHEGKLIACFTEEYIRCKQRGFGTSVIRAPVILPRAVQATEKLVGALEWTGIGHVDYLVDPSSNEPIFLEVNPRFWGALYMAIANGYDFPRALVELVTVGNVERSTIQPRPEPVAGVWLLGLGMSVMGDMARGALLAPVRALKEILSYHGLVVYDDFALRDPLPFLAQTLHYGLGFFRSGFSLNPVNPNMLRD